MAEGFLTRSAVTVRDFMGVDGSVNLKSRSVRSRAVMRPRAPMCSSKASLAMAWMASSRKDILMP